MRNQRFLQITAYAMIAAIFVFFMGITQDCGRIKTGVKEGFSSGDTLDIALIFSPGSYYLYNDTVAGINLDIAEIYSKEKNVPIKIWPITEPADGLDKLGKGAFDIIASLPLDNNIKAKFPVSESIFLDRLVLVQKKDSVTGEKSINSSLDLAGKTVYVAQGSSGFYRLKNLAEEIGDSIKIVEVPELSDELLTLNVANGSMDYVVANERVVKKLAETYPSLDYDSSISFTQFQVWVFNPNDTIALSKFSQWFDTFSHTERYREIISSY